MRRGPENLERLLIQERDEGNRTWCPLEQTNNSNNRETMQTFMVAQDMQWSVKSCAETLLPF